MKTSCSTKLLESAGANNIMQAIDIAVELGFDGINVDADCSFFSFDDFSFLKSAEIVRYAAEREIEIQCLSISALNSNEIKQEISRLNKAASIAHALACPIVSLSAPAMEEKDDIFTQYEKTTEIISSASKFAADFGICFAIETAKKTITDTFDKALQLFVDVDEYNFGVVLNSTSLYKNNEEQLGNNIEMIGESLLLVKITGEEETVATKNILRKLAKRGYSHYVSDCRCVSTENQKNELLSFIKLVKSIAPAHN